MTKQYFSTLLKRVGVSSLIGMAVLLLAVACPAPSGGGDDDGPSGTPPTPPTLSSVTAEDDGGTTIVFTESSDLYFKHTLITAKSTTNGGHTVTAIVPRGSARTGSVVLYGLKKGLAYDISLQAVSRDGTPSTATDTEPVVVKFTDAAKAAKKTAFFGRGIPVQDILSITPKLDKGTSTTSIKVHLPNIPSLAGIFQIDVLAVDADVDTSGGESQIVDASKDSKKSVLKEVKKPKSGQDVDLKKLKVAAKGANKGKVKVFYRLHDVNGVVSVWILTGDAVLPNKFAKDIKALKVTVGNQSIKTITWKPVTGYKTLITIVNTDTGTFVAEHTFAVGVKTAATVITTRGPFAALKGYLFGTGTYKITAKAVKSGISTTGDTKTVTVTDTIGPSGKNIPTPTSVNIVLSIKKVAGRILEVSIDTPPFEQDYAKTVIQVLVKEGSSDATSYKSITLNKGTLSKQFEGSKDGVYSATALFYDIMGNASKVAAGKKYTIASKVPHVKLASSDKKPTKVAVVIKASPTATKSPIVDGRVTVTWELTDATKSKSNQVKEWTVTPLQYVAAGTGDATRLSAKTVKGSKRKVTFTKLPLDKQYEFEVKGKDTWGLDIVAVKSSNKATLEARVPANILQKTGATVKKPVKNVTGTLLFTVGDSLDAGKNATHIELTLKKNSKIVKGYNKKLYTDDAKLKPLSPNMHYTAELRAYSSVTGKYSKVRTVGSFVVGDGSLAATTKIAAADMTPAAQGTRFSVAVTALAESTNTEKSASFGKHYDGSPLDNAVFELYYAKHGVTADSVTVGGATIAADIVKVVNATSDKKDAGKIAIANKAGLAKIEVTGLTKGEKYRYFIRTVNMIVNVRGINGGPKDVQLLSSPQILTPTVTAVTGKNQLKVRVPATTDFGNAKATGAKLNGSKVEYVFYYAKAGYKETIDGTEIEVVDGIDAQKIGSFNYDDADDADRGKVTLTSGSTNGVGANADADKLVSHLSASTKYYWFVRVQEKESAGNGTNSAVGSTTTQTGATVSGPPTSPSFSNEDHDSFDLSWTAPGSHGKLADGTNASNANHIAYTVYYISLTTEPTGTTEEEKAAFIKAAAKAATSGSNVAGVVQAEKGSTAIPGVSSKKFVGTVYVVVEAVNSQDTSKVSTLSTIEKYAITTAAAASTGALPAIAVEATATARELKLTLTTIVGGDTDKKKFGVQANGEAATSANVEYWAYFSKAADSSAGQIIAQVEAGNRDAVVAGTLLAANEDYGVFILGDPADGKTYTFTGLTGATEYYVVVRQVRKDSTGYDASDSESGTFERDSEVAQATTRTAAAASTGAAPVIAVEATATARELKLTLTTIVRGDTDKKKFGVQANGKAATSANVEYWAYFSKTVNSWANQIIEQVETGNRAAFAARTLLAANEDYGVFILDAPADRKTYTFTGLTAATKYYVVVRQVRTDSTGYDASNSESGAFERDSVLKEATTRTAAAAATGTAPVITVAPHAGTVGGVTVTITSITTGLTDKAKFGIKPNGDAVAGANVEYWLYYSKTGLSDDAAKIALEAEVVSPTVAVLGPINKDDPGDVGRVVTVGVMVLATPVAGNVFHITGLNAAAYRFFLRQTHPDGVGLDKTKSKSGTLGKDSNVAQQTPKA